MCAKESPFIITYRNEVYDITRFIKKHPGGVNTLTGLNNRDIEGRLKLAPPHSGSAMYLLREYKLDNQKHNYVESMKSNGHLNGNSTHHESNGKNRTNGTNGLHDLKNGVDESMEVSM